MRGHRQHSVSYVISHMKYLKNAYGIEGFYIFDELFNAKKEWIYYFCDEIEKNKLDIFYLIVGARVHNIDEKMLQRLKETGCIEIGYGQESGSDRILKEYYKGVTSQQNKKVTLLTTKKIGIHSPVQLVIGAPGETSETIKENIQFLKDLEAYTYSLNYLIPLPETPIWKQVESYGLVPDLEEYLDLVAEHGGMPLVNLTKVPDNEWGKWSILIKKEIQLYYYKKKNRKALYYIYKSFYTMLALLLSIIPLHSFKKVFPNKLTQFVTIIRNKL